MFWTLKFLPKNHLSYITGKLAAIRYPAFITRRLISWYVKRYGADVSEASKSIEEYNSLADFFTRDLKPGIRPQGVGVVSPVDGRISEFGEIVAGRLVQVKGRDYQISELLQSDQASEIFGNGYFITFYLAPGDYHHIHSPLSGTIVAHTYIQGRLWPVNALSVNRVADLFAVNERIVTYLQTELGRVAVVKVGATNVGAIGLAYDRCLANQSPTKSMFAAETFHKQHSPGISISKGERLGTFHMGSSVVLVFENGKFKADKNLQQRRVSYGETIGG